MTHYYWKERLNNGLEVTIRAAGPDDVGKIRRAFFGLKRETVYRRFFSYKSDISDEELHRITEVDFEQDVVILATITSADEETVIGEASYFETTTLSSVRSAEMAFTVEEDYQGLGLGKCLLKHVVGIARQNGFARLEADVLAGNTPMLRVFRSSGLPMTTHPEGDTVHVVLELERMAA